MDKSFSFDDLVAWYYAAERSLAAHDAAVLYGAKGLGAREYLGSHSAKTKKAKAKKVVVQELPLATLPAAVRKALAKDRQVSDESWVWFLAKKSVLTAAAAKSAIYLPSLNDRKELLPQLVQKAVHSKNYRIDELAMRRLQHHDWPGNLEELYFVLTEAMNSCANQVITVDDLMVPVPISSGEENYPQSLPPHLRE